MLKLQKIKLRKFTKRPIQELNLDKFLKDTHLHELSFFQNPEKIIKKEQVYAISIKVITFPWFNLRNAGQVVIRLKQTRKKL